MLQLLLLQCFIGCCCLGAGFLFYRVLPGGNNIIKAPVYYFTSGLVLLIATGQVIALFLPLNNLVRLIMLACLLGALAWHRAALSHFIASLHTALKNAGPVWCSCAAAAWLMVLLIAAGPTGMDDTESYHIQAVSWLNEYGTVPGIANLHDRYGFNSSWFTGVALFHIRSGNLNFYTCLNSVVSLVLFLYLLAKILHRKQQKNRIALMAGIMLVFSLINWPLARGNASTAGYDAITMLVVVLLFLETMEAAFDGLPSYPIVEYLLWPVFLVTIRLVNAPMMILALAGLILLYRTQRRVLIPLISFAMILLVPFFIRNVIVSGYPLYPSMLFDFFGADWKADPGRTKMALDYIRFYNRVSDRYQEISVTALQGFSEWIPQWFRFMFTTDKLLAVPGIAGIVSGIWLSRFINPINKLPVRFLVAALITQLLSWFFIAPDPRFIYGPLLCGTAMLALPLSRLRIPQLIYPAIASLTCVFCLYTFYSRKETLHAVAFAPQPLPSPDVREVELGNIHVSIPSKVGNNWNARCFDTPLPCLYEIYPGLQPRGNNISDGFRIVKEKQVNGKDL